MVEVAARCLVILGLCFLHQGSTSKEGTSDGIQASSEMGKTLNTLGSYPVQTDVLELLQESVNKSVSAAISDIKQYDAYIKNLTEYSIKHHGNAVFSTLQAFKQQLLDQDDNNINIIQKCITEEGQLDALAENINEEIKSCATVVMMEISNVISNSINEAQTFMTIPETIGKDVQACGLSEECVGKIVGDAFAEAIQVPPKVFALAAKIQQLNLHTVVSIDSCAVNSLTKIASMGISIVEDVLYCISDGIAELQATR